MCSAVGDYLLNSGDLRAFAEAWNGSWDTQSVVTVKLATTSDLTGVSCAGTMYCVAVGFYRLGAVDLTNMPAAALVERYR